MGRLGRAWAWVSAGGTDGLPDGKAKRVRILNQSSALFGVIAVPYVSLFAAIGAKFLAICVMLISASYWTALWLNHRRHYGLARILVMSTGNITMLTYSASLGLETDIHMAFMLVALEPLLFFEPHERRSILVWVLIPLGLQAARMLGYELFVPHTPVSGSAIEIVSMVLPLSCTVVALLIVVVFFRENVRQERRLGQLVERLRQRGEVLREANDQLSAEVTAREVAQRKAIKLQSRLLDTARKAGMAEISADLLHDVGNASSSLGVNVKQLHDRLARPVLPELSELSRWISSSQFPLREELEHHKRTAKLPSFIRALEGKLEQQREELLGYASTVAKGVGEVEQILRDQRQVTGAEQVVESAEVPETGQDAAAHKDRAEPLTED